MSSNVLIANQTFLIFKTFQNLLYYLRFLKVSQTRENLKQFFMLLYDCVRRRNQFLSIEKLLKKANLLQLEIGKNRTTPS